MSVRLTNAALVFACLLSLAPRTGFAQPQLGATELARARSLLELSRAELSAEQFSLLSSRLAETEAASIEFAKVTEAASEAAVVATEGGAASAEVAATGGRALLSSLGELVPLLLAWPSTAHAPGIKEEKPAVRAAREKLEERIKALAQAARQVDAEKRAVQGSSRHPDDTDCHLDGSGGGGTARSSKTCTYHCDGAVHIIVLPVGTLHCPGESTYTIKWKTIKGFPQKP